MLWAFPIPHTYLIVGIARRRTHYANIYESIRTSMRDRLQVVFVSLWNLQRKCILHKSYCSLVRVRGGGVNPKVHIYFK